MVALGCCLYQQTTNEEKTHTCMYWCHPTYHWRLQTVQAIKTHNNTHNEDRDKTILNRKGSLAHLHLCHNLDMLLTFWWTDTITMMQKKWIFAVWQHNALAGQVISFSTTEKIINDSLFCCKKYVTNRLLVVSRTNYAPGSPAETTFCFSWLSVKFLMLLNFSMHIGCQNWTLCTVQQ